MTKLTRRPCEVCGTDTLFNGPSCMQCGVVDKQQFARTNALNRLYNLEGRRKTVGGKTNHNEYMFQPNVRQRIGWRCASNGFTGRRTKAPGVRR